MRRVDLFRPAVDIFRGDEPGGVVEGQECHILVIVHDDVRDAQHPRDQLLRPRAVGERQVRLVPDSRGSQLEPPVDEAEKLHQGVLAVVLPDRLAFQPVEIDETGHLEAVAGCDHAVVAAVVQLIDDGLEQRDVRRIVEIDPDFFMFFRFHDRFTSDWGFTRRFCNLLILHVPRHIPRQGVPILPLIGCLHIFQKLAVMLRRVCLDGLACRRQTSCSRDGCSEAPSRRFGRSNRAFPSRCGYPSGAARTKSRKSWGRV